jgi:hypothetical protein
MLTLKLFIRSYPGQHLHPLLRNRTQTLPTWPSLTSSGLLPPLEAAGVDADNAYQSPPTLFFHLPFLEYAIQALVYEVRRQAPENFQLCLCSFRSPALVSRFRLHLFTFRRLPVRSLSLQVAHSRLPIPTIFQHITRQLSALQQRPHRRSVRPQ